MMEETRSENENRKVYQPIHPSIRSRLDPEYINFHEDYLQYLPASESVPFDPASRYAVSNSPRGASTPVQVGSIRDFDFGGHEQLRVFTPQEERPLKGWPVLVWFHGGGWTLGGLDSENSFLTRCCKEAKCCVVSANYRHAPENPYPAAINDAVEAYSWIVSAAGQAELGIDAAKVAVGGLSAGGGLAAIVSLKTAFLGLPKPIFQMLILPVIDNTATAETAWSNNVHAPWLTPSRMLWYRNMYLPHEEDWARWDVSPNLAPKDLLAQSPPTWIAVAELDILCREAERFGGLLREAGVDSDVVSYEGSTHWLLMLDGVLAIGRRLVGDATGKLSSVFGTV